MKAIDGKSFTVIHIEDSNYEDKGVVTTGVKLTTKESFEIEGEKWSKFHTTRIAVVKKFSLSTLREDINEGKTTLGPIKCVEEKTNAGKNFFNLVDA